MSRRFRICMAKGGRESARPSYGRPKLTLILSQKKNLKRCWKKPYGHNFHISALKLNQRYFDIYEISLIQFQGWNLKIVAERFWGTPPYFCWQLAFYRHLPTSGRQNTVKTAPQPLIVNRASFYPSRYLFSFSTWRPKTKKFPFFTNFHVALVKKTVGLLQTQFWCHRPST